MLHSHIVKDRKDESESQKHEKSMDCPFCEDKFISIVAYDSHLKDHLEEIKGIDIEYLKNAHEIFDLSMCEFQSK